MLHLLWWYIGVSLVVGISTYFLIGLVEPGLGQLIGIGLLPFVNIYSFYCLIAFLIWWISKGRFEKSIGEFWEENKL